MQSSLHPKVFHKASIFNSMPVTKAQLEFGIIVLRQSLRPYRGSPNDVRVDNLLLRAYKHKIRNGIADFDLTEDLSGDQVIFFFIRLLSLCEKTF